VDIRLLGGAHLPVTPQLQPLATRRAEVDRDRKVRFSANEHFGPAAGDRAIGSLSAALLSAWESRTP
jgi:hypothetical protein